MVGFGRGHGQQFVLSEAAGLMAQWIRRLDIGPAHMVGHSMGGYITLELAANEPELVDHLVLVDALALPIERDVWSNGMALLQAARSLPLDFFPVLITDSVRAGPICLAKAIYEVMEADISQELHRIQAPALIVWGEDDPLLPLQLGLDLFHELPAATMRIIRGAGHNPMWDRPNAFHTAVGEFLCARPEAAGHAGCGETSAQS